MSNELEQIKVQLNEKNQLVEALTTRLEQAAEQLDRIRRTGGDRKVKLAGGSGGGSIPSEFLDQQKQIATDVQNMSQQWTEMETTGSIARIEHQLGDVRDLIVDLCQKQQELVENGISGASFNPPAQDVSSFLDQIEDNDTSEQLNTAESIPVIEETPEISSDNGFDFNALKNSLLNNESVESSETSEEDPISQIVEQVEEIIEEVNAPSDIAFAGATHDQLCEAVEQRDAYIAYLLRKLRVSQTLQISMPDWEALEGIPEELLKEAHHLSDQLNEQLRLAEVENSVERARLGREANRLQQLQAKLDKERVHQEKSQSDEDNIDEDPSSSRWMKMLSRNRKNNDVE